MAKSILRLAIMSGTALAAFYAAPALAQGGATGADDSSEIIVTARRVEERLQDVPISITVFTPAQISDRNIASSVDLAKYTPSLTVNTRFGPDKASFIIRGFSTDPQTAPSVAVYLADVVAPRLSSNTQSGNGAGPGTLLDVQNIQVLKGPQGTLFGRNTSGGAIIVVPRKPTDKFEGYAEGTVGNRDALRVQGAINIPLGDRLRARFAIDRYKRDGYLHNRLDLGGVGPKDFNNINYTAMRASLVADVTEDIENYTLVNYARSNTHGTVARLVFCSPTAPATNAALRTANCAQVARFNAAGAGFYDVANSIANPFNRQRNLQFINTTTWRTSDALTVKNIASYSRSYERYSQNIGGDAHALPSTQIFPGRTQSQGRQRTITEELQFQGNFGKLTWQAGGYMEVSDPIGDQEQNVLAGGVCTDFYGLQCTLSAAGAVAIQRNTYKFRDYAVYAQSSYKFTDQLSVTAGIRYTWDRASSHSHNYTIRPITGTLLTGPASATFRCTAPAVGSGTVDTIRSMCDINYAIRSKKPTWLLGIDYKPTEDLLVYAKYSRGYRAGGINPQVNGPISVVTWQPEKIDNYEAGVKATFRGRIRGTFNVNVFYNDFQNQQASIFLPACTVAGQGAAVCTTPPASGVQLITNAGTSKIKGVEVDSSLDLFEGFRLDFAYAYLDAKLKKLNAPASCLTSSYVCSAASGQPLGALVFSPKNRVTVTGTYTLPLSPDIGRVSVGATFTHTDTQRFSYTGRNLFLAGTIPFDPSLLPATDLLNLNLNWNNVFGKPFDLGLFVTNVTNEKYHVADAGSLPGAATASLILGEPRMFGARVKVRFGD